MSMPGGLGTRSQTNAGSIEAFLEGWLVRQEHYLDELLSTQQHCHEMREEDLKELISRILAHYQEYYEEKSRMAHRDIFLVFSPTWFTSFERAFLWIAGFKPGLAFRLVTDAVDDLSEDQRQRINMLMEETKVEDRALSHELAKIQESVGAPPLLELARCAWRANGEVSEENRVLDAWKSALETLVANADSLRMNTAVKVVEILRPAQTVRFLAAAAQLQLRIRTWGLQREAERQE
ncbi:protein RESPONSE TO ABA AND SALT 1-like [Corylus avellana]|uniref:protein RESPONSE TO ABA AND SALT 1-like n=1 Tax=Corylus avellana TaxID=13451 RepID=UPI001E1FE769|nr:protein RESPONSE TO ABA AND SALT 1-like [Corylus avellana]